MNKHKQNIAIIGAGIIGLACAVRLRKAGHSVTLIDKNEPGKGTSFGNAGHIATEQIHPLASPQTIAALPKYLLDPTSPIKLPFRYLAQVTPWLLRFAYASRPSQFKQGTAALKSLQERAMSDLEILLETTGHPELLHQSGNLVVLENPANIQAAQKEISTCTQQGIAVNWLSASEVKAIAPSLNNNIVGAMHFTKTGHVTNPYSICQALEEYLRKAGAIFINEEVLTLKHCLAGLEIITNNQTIQAEKAIISAGAFSKKIANNIGIYAPLETERGYHIHLNNEATDFHLPIASYERKIIMTPMSDGLRATGIVEFGGLNMPPRDKNFATISNHVKDLLPNTSTHGASTWMGYRPSLPDHLPFIGYGDDSERVICAFGHQHLGLTLCGVTAQLVEELIAGQPTSVNLKPFAPSRFS